MGRHSRRSHVKRCGTCGKYRVVGAGWMDWATKAGLSAASKAASWGQRGMALGQKAAAAYKRAAPAIQSAREAYSKAAPLLAAALAPGAAAPVGPACTCGERRCLQCDHVVHRTMN